MVPRSRNAMVVMDPLRLCASQKNLLFRRGDAAARALSGPLTKTQRRTIKVHDYGDPGVIALRQHGTIIRLGQRCKWVHSGGRG